MPAEVRSPPTSDDELAIAAWERDPFVSRIVDNVAAKASAHLQRMRLDGPIAVEAAGADAALEVPRFSLSMQWPPQEEISVSRLETLRSGLQITTKETVDIEYDIDMRELRINVYASGFRHGGGVGELNGAFGIARHANLFRHATICSDGLAVVGSQILAPDLVIHSFEPRDHPDPGTPGCPITYVGEVEHSNRSLPELIRHLGMVMGVFPQPPAHPNPPINGAVGCKLLQGTAAHSRAVLFVIGRNAAGVPVVTDAYDFGAEPMSPQQRIPADAAMTDAFGAAPVWTRVEEGRDAQGQEVVVEIPFETVVEGVLDAAGAPLNLANMMPPGVGWVPVRIELERMLQILAG